MLIKIAEKNGNIDRIFDNYDYDFIRNHKNFNDIVYIDISVDHKCKQKLTSFPFELPPKLITLKFNNHQITKIDNPPNTLQFVSARMNRLTDIDWFQNCKNIENVDMYANDCENIECSGVPESLRELNLSYNKIKTINIENITNEYLRINLEFNFLKNIPKFFENPNVTGVFNNNDISTPVVPFRPVIDENIEIVNDFNYMQNPDNLNVTEVVERTRMRNRNQIHQIEKDLAYSNKQNVHHSDVNKTVVESINKLLTYANEFKFDYNKYLKYLDDYNKNIIEEKDKKKNEFSYLKDHPILTDNYDHMKRIKKQGKKTRYFGIFKRFTPYYKDVIYHIEEDNYSNSTFGPDLVRYGDLLRIVWFIIDLSKDKEELMRIFHTNMKESIGYCFVGRMTRLLDVLSGYVDCVRIGVSEKQAINARAIELTNKLKKEYNEESDEFVTAYKEEMKKLLEDYPEMPEAEKFVWLEAYG